MHCNHCQKEEETITIAGKTYCANCSNVLSEKKISSEEIPKHKMPKMEPTENEIRTEAPKKHETQKIDPGIKTLAHDLNIPAKSADELGSSAILLDILSHNAAEELDDAAIQKSEKLEKASEKVLETLTDLNPTIAEAPKKKMNDITSKIRQRADRVDSRSHGMIKKAEEAAKREVEEIKKPLKNEVGLSREYDILIIFLVISAILFVLMALLAGFKMF